MAAEAMAKFIDANGKDEKKSLAELRTTDFDELQKLFREVAAEAIKENKTIYELLREQLPAYPA
jgi:hypothetical protein